jgi:hypothetical protein
MDLVIIGTRTGLAFPGDVASLAELCNHEAMRARRRQMDWAEEWPALSAAPSRATPQVVAPAAAPARPQAALPLPTPALNQSAPGYRSCVKPRRGAGVGAELSEATENIPENIPSKSPAPAAAVIASPGCPVAEEFAASLARRRPSGGGALSPSPRQKFHAHRQSAAPPPAVAPRSRDETRTPGEVPAVGTSYRSVTRTLRVESVSDGLAECTVAADTRPLYQGMVGQRVRVPCGMLVGPQAVYVEACGT